MNLGSKWNNKHSNSLTHSKLIINNWSCREQTLNGQSSNIFLLPQCNSFWILRISLLPQFNFHSVFFLLYLLNCWCKFSWIWSRNNIFPNIITIITMIDIRNICSYDKVFKVVVKFPSSSLCMIKNISFIQFRIVIYIIWWI